MKKSNSASTEIFVVLESSVAVSEPSSLCESVARPLVLPATGPCRGREGRLRDLGTRLSEGTQEPLMVNVVGFEGPRTLSSMRSSPYPTLRDASSGCGSSVPEKWVSSDAASVTFSPIISKF